MRIDLLTGQFKDDLHGEGVILEMRDARNKPTLDPRECVRCQVQIWGDDTRTERWVYLGETETDGMVQ